MSIPNFDEIRKDLKSYLTRQQIYDVILDSFDTLKLDQEKVELCWVLLSESKLFPDFKLSHVKSKESSEKFRLDGNKDFSINKNLQAIRSYTLAAGYAEPASRELVLAIANRSAVSACLDDHKNCLRDIEFSLNKNYPENLKYKLFERKGKSLICLGQYDAARLSLEVYLVLFFLSVLYFFKVKKKLTIYSYNFRSP